MRHVALTTAAAFTALVAIVACEQQSPDLNPTAPDVVVSYAKPVGTTACNSTIGRAITSQIADFFVKPQLTTAKSLWADVADNCVSNNAYAREAMLTYVQFTIDRFKAGEVFPDTGSAASRILAHWNLTFVYVGDSAPNLPLSVLGPLGAAGVITQTTVERELRAAKAAITVPVQDADGDQRGHLFTINPESPIDCLGDINLDQSGPCYNFHSFPKVNPKFSPMVQVGICQELQAGVDLPLERKALGHLKNGNFVEIPPLVSYPTFCADLAEVDPGSWNGGITGITKRLAWLANKTFGVKSAYAVHGGLGGLGDDISPWGGVDRTVLFAPQHDEIIPNFPAQPEIGTWTSLITSPGTITTAASLGNYTDTMIVLSQAGGNCTNCGGLMLQGNLADSTAAQAGATDGRYEVGWTSLNTSSNIKNAPFVVRDGLGNNIATLAYSTEQSVNRLRYNGHLLNIAWVQNDPQDFIIEVNLNNYSTKLFINGTQIISGARSDSTYAFQDGDATSMRQFAADFSGIDSGVMGWAKIFVRRLNDF